MHYKYLLHYWRVLESTGEYWRVSTIPILPLHSTFIKECWGDCGHMREKENVFLMVGTQGQAVASI